MSTYEKAQEVIDYSKFIHTRMRDYYEMLSQRNQPERVKLMLDYLIEARKQSETSLARTEEDIDRSVLESWMQYTPDFDIDELIGSKKPEPEITLDELINIAQEFNGKLADFYQEAANESELPKVQKLFEKLAEMEAKDNIKQLQAASFEDM